MPRHATSGLNYIRKLYAPQDSLLDKIDSKLNQMDMAIHIGAEEGKMLQLFMHMHCVRTVVEIGTLGGYSTLWLARALPEGGHVYTINKDPAHIALAKEHFSQSECSGSITMLEGDAHEILPQLAEKGPFDMLFIDADKISYNDYLDWAENNHIRKGGLIVADNTLLFGTMEHNAPPDNIAPATWNAMRRFNERLAVPENYFGTIIPTQEGLSVAIKLF